MPDDKIETAARLLAEHLASEDGKRALAEAAERTRARTKERLEASRVDTQLLLKRVTPL